MNTPLAAPGVPVPRHSVDVSVLVRRTQQLLAAGVPLTLLLDLGDEDPHSQARYASEEADLDWVPRR